MILINTEQEARKFAENFQKLLKEHRRKWKKYTNLSNKIIISPAECIVKKCVMLFSQKIMEELEFHQEQAETFCAQFIENQKNKKLKDPNNAEKFKNYYTWLARGFKSIIFLLPQIPQMLQYIQNLEAENEILQSRIKQLETFGTQNEKIDRFRMLTDAAYKEQVRAHSKAKADRYYK